MGNEHSNPAYDIQSKGVDKEFENMVLPPMVLIIEAVLWPQSPGAGSQTVDDIRLTQRSWTSVTSIAVPDVPQFGTSAPPRIWCTASLDGREMGQPISFPLPPMQTVGGPLKVIPQNPGSVLTLRFSTEIGDPGVISIPLYHLIRYGVPLYSTLWLGIPWDGGNGYQTDFKNAIAKGQLADVPKVALTIFRPARHQDFHGMAVAPEPDVHSALAEDMDTCTGSAKRAPTAAAQIMGLARALRLLSVTTHNLQDALFQGSNRNAANVTKQLHDTMAALNPKAESKIQNLQDMLDSARQDNTRLQVEKSTLQQHLQQQEEHWRSQLENKDSELQAVRNGDSLRCSELMRSIQGHQDFAKEQQDEIEQARQKLEELANLRAQLQSQKDQNSNLQREVMLATDELENLKALDERRLSLSQDHAQAQEALVRTQASLSSAQQELAQAREDLKRLPMLEKKIDYLEAELKIARTKAETAVEENGRNQQELARARATVESLRLESETSSKRLETQLTRADAELEVLRARDAGRVTREEELARLRVEHTALRSEKEQWSEELVHESKRWNAELDALRVAKEQSVDLQEELLQKSTELEALRAKQRQQQTIQDAIALNSEEDEKRHQEEDAVLKETLGRLRAAAPQRLKELREECATLRERDKERIRLQEDYEKLRAELQVMRAASKTSNRGNGVTQSKGQITDPGPIVNV